MASFREALIAIGDRRTVVQLDTGIPVVTTSCTDHASQPTAISSTPAAVYNSHGDATSIDGQWFWYDSSDRVVVGAGVGGAQTVTYASDASGRIVTRVGTGTGAGVDTTSGVYSYTGDEDSPDLQLTSAGTILERYLSLHGGVLHTKGYANPGQDNWALPNIHGDTLTTTTSMSIAIDDPFGNSLDPATGLVDQTTDPATRISGLTDAWPGANQRGTEHTADAVWTLMGARTYLPDLGQFTTTDPVEGGNVIIQASVLDFGLAVVLGVQTGLTLAGRHAAEEVAASAAESGARGAERRLSRLRLSGTVMHAARSTQAASAVRTAQSWRRVGYQTAIAAHGLW